MTDPIYLPSLCDVIEEVARTTCYNALIRDANNHSAIIRTGRKKSLEKVTICEAYGWNVDAGIHGMSMFKFP